MSERAVTERDLEGVLRRLNRLEAWRDGLKIEVPLTRLPYAQRVLNPFPLASSGGVPGDFPQSTTIEILAFCVSVLVSTTSNGANYWTLNLVNTAAAVLASVNTSTGVAANTWTRLTDTTIVQPSASNVDLAIIATATGSPGAIFIVPEVLVL